MQNYPKPRWAFGLLTLLFTLLHAPGLNAQSNRIEELREELKTVQDTDRVIVLYNLGRSYYPINLDTAAFYIDQSSELARTLHYDYGIGLSLFGKAYIHHLKEQHQEAEQLYLQSIPILKKEERMGFVMDAYGYLGSIYSLWGQYAKSLDNYQKGLDLARQQNDGIGIGILAFGMADTYTHIGEFQKGISLLEESRQHITHRSLLTNYYSILGNLYRQIDKLNLSLTAFEEAIAICEELADTLRMAYVHHDIGLVYLDLGEYEKAGTHFFTTIRLNEKLATPILTLVSNLGLGEMHLLTKDYDNSRAYYQQALEAAKDNQISEKIPACYLGMAKVSRGEEEHQQALTLFQKGLAAAQETGLQEAIIDARLEIGRTYIALQSYDEALEILSETFELINEELGQPECLMSALYGAIGQLYLKQQQRSKSVNSLLEGLVHARQCSNKLEEEFYYKHLYTAYLGMDSMKQSLHYYEQYTAIRDTLLNANNKQQLISLLLAYDTEQKEKTIDLLKKEQQIQQMNMRQQQMLLLVLGVILVLSVLLFWLLFNRYKWRKKNQELELKSLQIELEKQNLETSQQLEMAELRSNLFTDISHELRSPLSLLIAPLEELLQQSKASEEQKTLKLMHRNALRLLELVNQTLDFSKLDNGQLSLDLAPYPIGLLAKQMADNFMPLSRIKNIELHVGDLSGDLALNCDRDKIEKILSNLLSNAIEHTPSGGRIDLILEVLDTELRIEVRDSGVGIATKHLPHIFDRFYQVDQRSRKGSGIGLALVRELVHLHGGRIEVDSEEGKGTAFRISLPTQPLPAIQAPPGQLEASVRRVAVGEAILPAGKLSEATILVVEDHKELREYIVDLLMRQGFKVISAAEGREAMELALQFSPELVISDVMMPGVDGFAFARHLRQEFLTSHIPIILLTAKSNANSKLEGLDIGADDYLTKPFHASELLARSRNLILQRRRLRQLFEADPSIANRRLSSNSMDEQFMAQAIDLVEQRIEDASFNVERFCQEIGMSRTNLYNKLKALTGKNIAEFIRMIRLRRATELIESNSGNIYEVAAEVGFNTRQAFNKAFKDRYGLTPTEYKRKKKVIKR